MFLSIFGNIDVFINIDVLVNIPRGAVAGLQQMKRKKNITGVITGDLVKSRKIASKTWLPALKGVLSTAGSSPKMWEIYRGDSFQLEVKPEHALLMAIKIKAAVKCIKNLDVRMAIGIGVKEFSAPKITESNGEAFVNSGEKLEALKVSKQNLAIRTAWPEFDREMNLYFRLSLIIMDNWSRSSAELMGLLIDHGAIAQHRLAKKLKITQSSVSARIKRACYAEVMELETLYREKIIQMTGDAPTR